MKEINEDGTELKINGPNSQGNEVPGARANNQNAGNYKNNLYYVDNNDNNIESNKIFEFVLKKIEKPNELASRLFMSEKIAVAFPKAKNFYLTPLGDIKFVYNDLGEVKEALKTDVSQFGEKAFLKPLFRKFKYEIVVMSLPVKTKDDVLLKYLKASLHGAVNARWSNNNSIIANLIVSFNDKKSFDAAIKLGSVKIGHRYFKIKKLQPPKKIQCRNCLRFGHSKKICLKEKRCFKCGRNHLSIDCKAREKKCPNCKGGHSAFSPKCPLRATKKEVRSNAWERAITRAIDRGFKNFEEKLADKVTQRLNDFKYTNKNPSLNTKAHATNNYKNTNKCSYIPPFKLNKSNTIEGSFIKIASFNARSINKRKDELFNYMKEENIDIINIQETWLNENSRFKCEGYKMISTKFTNRKGSGVATLIRNNIKFKLIDIKRIGNEIELIVCEIKIKRDYLRIINVYIHPNAKIDEMQVLNEYLENNKTILVGDVNAHHKSWSRGKSNKRGITLKNILNSQSMEIINNNKSYTHYSKKDKAFSSPDIMAVSKEIKPKIFGFKIGPNLGSDHFPMSICIKSNGKILKKLNKSHWKFDKMNKKQYEENLENSFKNFETIVNTQNIDQINLFINNELTKTTDKNCPKTKCRSSFRGNPWWNDECNLFKKTKNVAWRKFMKSRLTKDEELFTKHNKAFRRVVLKAKNTYYNNLFKNGDPKIKYKIFKALSTNQNNTMKKVEIKGTYSTDYTDIANEIGIYFSKIGTSTQTNKKEITQTKLNLISNHDNLVLNRKIEIWEFSNICKKLNPRKAAGIDAIYPFMIKYAGEKFLDVLCKFFNKSFDEGVIPNEWYKSIIIPIPKSNDNKLGVENFRPISLTPTIAKIMERIINNRLKIICEHKNILPTCQKGFRKNRSTFDNLSVLQNEIAKTFKTKKIMIACFLDVKKAYDTVNKNILYNMLKSIGFKGKILKWLKVFLQPRKNKVIFENQLSEEIEFEKGVPQGSPLSSLLFNIYVRDLGYVNQLNISQFADDIVIWVIGDKIETIQRELNSKLKIINKIITSIDLEFAPNKCIVTTFTKKWKNIKEPNIMLNGIKLKNTKSAKYLGIIFDSKLTWKNNTSYIVKKVNKRIGALKCLSRKSNNIHQSDMLNLYKLFIRPVLEYGSEIWGKMNQGYCKKLDSIQHRCIAISLGVNRLSPLNDTCYEGKMLPLKQRRDIKIIKTWKKKLTNDDVVFLNTFSPQMRQNIILENNYSNFSGKLLQAIEKYNLNNEKIMHLSNRELKKNITESWLQSVKNEKSIVLFDISKNIPNNYNYKKFNKSKNITRIWHQTRLKSLPLNDFLNKIGVKKNKNCPRCGLPETTQHLVNRCEDNSETGLKDVRRLFNENLKDTTKLNNTVQIIRNLQKRKRNEKSKAKKKEKINCGLRSPIAHELSPRD